MFFIHFIQGVFKRQKEQGQKGRPDDVPYVLARSIRDKLQYQAAAGIGARGVGNMAVRGKCMERAMQMFYVEEEEGILWAVVEAFLRYCVEGGRLRYEVAIYSTQEIVRIKEWVYAYAFKAIGVRVRLIQEHRVNVLLRLAYVWSLFFHSGLRYIQEIMGSLALPCKSLVFNFILISRVIFFRCQG